MNRKHGVSVILAFMVTLLVSVFALSSTAYGAAKLDDHELQEFNVKASSNNKQIDFDSKLPGANKNNGTPVHQAPSIQSNFDVTGDRMNFEDSLTADDPDDFWFFSVDSDRSILFELQTDNPNYIVELYQVDWDTGTAYPTSIGGYDGDLIANNQLPAGDWALRVYSTDTLEDSYTVKMNATNPSGAASVISTSSTLLYAVLSYPSGEIYSNGNYVATIDGDNAHLDWEREYYFAWDGNYNQRDHNISDVHIKSISGPVNYSSSYASSSNALLIYLDEETLFTYHESSYRSGPPTQYSSSFVDTLGKTTPRRLDTDDLTNYGDHILVLDVNSGETIDFFSVLNYYYASGVEPIPTINFLN
ncbi:hypothetical protein [Virgibacillus salexigens]|uniref:hypothetical protein n=1 Tax=Virgibacillus massiliensis TaxID=1462526 RepID=UPI00136990A8|nr:hypothetical protein [Virgibacillus massiliensis]MYL41218.1 hypothetical protein [Virgibacillus massiliensis]